MKAITSNGSSLEQAFAWKWRLFGGAHKLEREWRFREGRRWRFDFAHPGSMVAVELEGGVHRIGRHQRPAGFHADAEDGVHRSIASARGLR